MQLANVDTLIGHIHVARWLERCSTFLRDLASVEAESPFEPVRMMYRGLDVQTYPDRTTTHWHAFKVWLPTGGMQNVSLEFRIYDRPLKEASNQWPIEVIYRSAPLWTVPFGELWHETLRTLTTLADEPVPAEDILTRVSRVDIAIDTDELQFEEKDRDRLVTRAKHQSQYIDTYAWDDEETESVDENEETLDQAMYHQGDRFTGFTFVKGKILCRIYNKWWEIARSASYKQDKRFFAELWQKAGWDLTKDVWRIEFQLRREALHEFQVLESNLRFAKLSIPEVLANAPSLLTYLMQDWISLRTPTGSANRAKWPMDPAWQKLVDTIQMSYGVSERHPLEPQLNPYQLAKVIKGYLTAFAVAVGESSSQGLMAKLPRLLARYLEIAPQDLEHTLDAEITRKALLQGVQTLEEVACS
ncbi:hypothetical protein [Alicyclobacillus vulcanalis]|uniref:Replication initiation factor n=1 Tax=Alicyclobacillus vulcanalis TaxID=252246 RepID=A0A1N7PFA9_9BACL|nr:hypothetical protein [Alicyclobacillus vulcanalis]SIT09226.1 hypothetical protein SAMN05421799_11316 [Alicyclobacillus vulcanalis]